MSQVRKVCSKCGKAVFKVCIVCPECGGKLKLPMSDYARAKGAGRKKSGPTKKYGGPKRG
jgi:hypothetical protein